MVSILWFHLTLESIPTSVTAYVCGFKMHPIWCHYFFSSEDGRKSSIWCLKVVIYTVIELFAPEFDFLKKLSFLLFNIKKLSCFWLWSNRIRPLTKPTRLQYKLLWQTSWNHGNSLYWHFLRELEIYNITFLLKLRAFLSLSTCDKTEYHTCSLFTEHIEYNSLPTVLIWLYSHFPLLPPYLIKNRKHTNGPCIR